MRVRPSTASTTTSSPRAAPAAQRASHSSPLTFTTPVGRHSSVTSATLPIIASGPVVGVARLPTHYGVLNYSLRRYSPSAVQVRLSGDVNPPGHIVVQPPLTAPLKAVTVNGTPIHTFNADSAVITDFPAEVVLESETPETPTATP